MKGLVNYLSKHGHDSRSLNTRLSHLSGMLWRARIESLSPQRGSLLVLPRWYSYLGLATKRVKYVAH